MHALNGLVSVVVSANMAYLACTIVLPIYTCKINRPPNLHIKRVCDTIKGALKLASQPVHVTVLNFAFKLISF